MTRQRQVEQWAEKQLPSTVKKTRRQLARLRLKQMTPSNAQLRKLAAKRQPPAAYFEGDVERPW